MSNVLTQKNKTTIVGTAVRILTKIGNEQSFGPVDIVRQGLKQGLVRIPDGRDESYVVQIFQSSLYNNAYSSKNPSIKRTTRGRYKVTARARKAQKTR